MNVRLRPHIVMHQTPITSSKSTNTSRPQIIPQHKRTLYLSRQGQPFHRFNKRRSTQSHDCHCIIYGHQNGPSMIVSLRPHTVSKPITTSNAFNYRRSSINVRAVCPGQVSTTTVQYSQQMKINTGSKSRDCHYCFVFGQRITDEGAIMISYSIEHQ